jgi:hypothetical protein
MRDWLIMNNMGRLLKEGIYSLSCCYGLRLWKIKGEGKLSWYSERLCAEQLGFDSRQGQERDFSLLRIIQTCSGALPTFSQVVTGSSFSHDKVAWWVQADLSPSCSARINITPLHTYSWNDVQLIKRRDKFSLYVMQFHSFWNTTVT